MEENKVFREMKGKAVIYERKGKIATIKLNRPERLNAENRQMVIDLQEALDIAREDNEAQVVIVTGEGRAFCAGEDLKESTEGKTLSEYFDDMTRLQELQWRMFNLGKPTIAAVRGYALGGGCEIAMGCDIRIAAEDAQFGLPETGVGLGITNAGTKLAPLLMGLSKAKELAFTGEFMGAQEAERRGMVNKVVPGDKLLEEAQKMAEKILQKSPLAIWMTKVAMDQGLSLSLDQILQLELSQVQLAIASGAAQRYSTKKLEAVKKKGKEPRERY